MSVFPTRTDRHVCSPMMDEAKYPGTTNRRLNGSLLNGWQHHRSIIDEELSLLEDDIKKAYTMKTLHAQRTEHEAARLAAGIQERISEQVAQLRASVEEEESNRLEKTKRERRVNELRATLDRQVEEKCEERVLVEEEERRERKLLVEVDRLREEEEEMEKTCRKEKIAQQLLRERLVQREIREINKRKLEELEAHERERNEAYERELEERAEYLKRLRVDAMRKREEAIEKVAKIMLDMENEKEERRRLLLDLAVETVKCEAEVEAREMDLHRRKRMKEFAEDLKEQIRFEEECRRRFLEREKQFAEAILAKIRESERMERLTAVMRRRRQLEYREELEHMMQERERARRDELVRLKAIHEEELLREEVDREEARRARMLLLEQHIENVAGFMSDKRLYNEEKAWFPRKT